MSRAPDFYGIRCADGQWLSAYALRCSYKSGTSASVTYSRADRAMHFDTPAEAEARARALALHGSPALLMTLSQAPLWQVSDGGRAMLTEIPQ